MTGPHLDQYLDTHGQHRWRTTGPNGRITGDSAEGYHNEPDMQHGALRTLEALLNSGLPGVHRIVAEWIMTHAT